jgi:hypothetical protein
MTDLTHINALRFSHEAAYLANAKTQREIEAELVFLGLADDDSFDGSDDDLLAELMA